MSLAYRAPSRPDSTMRFYAAEWHEPIFIGNLFGSILTVIFGIVIIAEGGWVADLSVVVVWLVQLAIVVLAFCGRYRWSVVYDFDLNYYASVTPGKAVTYWRALDRPLQEASKPVLDSMLRQLQAYSQHPSEDRSKRIRERTELIKRFYDLQTARAAEMLDGDDSDLEHGRAVYAELEKLTTDYQRRRRAELR